MKVYTHLKLEEREKIFEMRQNKRSIRAIAKDLERSVSTILRELKRNRYNDSIKYLPDKADLMAQKRKYILRPKINQNNEIRSYIIQKLQEKWSPDVIAGRLRIEKKDMVISTETIYQYIYSAEGIALGLFKYLASQRKQRNKLFSRKMRKNIIPDRIDIHARSKAANDRIEPGHYEGDLTFFSGNQSENILTITERVTRYTFIIKQSSKKAVSTGKALFNTFAYIPQSLRKSITFDNGLEFAKHAILRQFLGMETFFCDRHSPWQKGQVEKTNAMIHRFLPKNRSIHPVNEASLLDIQNQFNSIPRKKLNYRTPTELFNQLLQGCCTSN